MTKFSANKFQGNLCSKCGGTLRYIKYNVCVNCEKLRSQTKRNNADYQQQQKEYRQTNKLKQKAYMQVRRYGVTYDDLIWLQGFKCAICGDQLLMDKKTHIDHKGDKVRGILCHMCNVGLGHFKDSIRNLENAIAYLRKSES